MILPMENGFIDLYLMIANSYAYIYFFIYKKEFFDKIIVDFLFEDG